MCAPFSSKESIKREKINDVPIIDLLPNCRKQCCWKSKWQSTSRAIRGVGFQRIGSRFGTLSFFPLTQPRRVDAAAGSRIYFLTKDFWDGETKFSEGDASSFSECQPEQEARSVLCVVTRLIYVLGRRPSTSSCQSPSFHLVRLME